MVDPLRRIACAALLCLCPGLPGAENPAGHGGFLLEKNGAGPGVTAIYHDDAAFGRVYRSTDVKREDFIPPGRLHEHPHVEYVFYAYGYVVDADDFLELAKVESLRGLTIGFVGCADDWATVDGDISQLGAVKQLEIVSLNARCIADDDLRFIAALPRLTSIEVNVGGANEDVGRQGPGCTDRCAEHLSKAAGLETLWIQDGDKLSDQFVDQLTAGTGKLKWLELDSPLLTDESLRFLAERCPHLEHLSLDSTRLTDAGVGQLVGLKNLRSLWLHSGVSAETVALTATLREVVLTGCLVSDQGAAALASLRDLERLVLRGPELTDEQFGFFRSHPALHDIILNGSRLTRDATLPVLESMPNLESVIIVGNEALQHAVNGALKQGAVEP